MSDRYSYSEKHGQMVADRDGLWTHYSRLDAHEKATARLAVERAEFRSEAERLEAQVKELERDVGLGKAIERAAAELPEGFTICIDIERGAGTVRLQDENGEELEDDSGDPLAEQINGLIDEAIRSEAEIAAEQQEEGP